MAYLRELRRLIPIYGADNVVYVDETGFQKYVTRTSGWAVRGQKIYGDVRGNNRKTTNLIMAQRRREWLAPMLFKGTCDHIIVNTWIETQLIPELDKPSIVIMDNASFHKKKDITAILEKHGHVFLPLPPYSPDFNPIENTFGTIKKRREHAPTNTPLDHFFKPSDS
jgi:putative transposase